MEEFTLRAHHGMCLTYFKGKGYSGPFVTNMVQVKHFLEEEDPVVTVIAGADHVCSHCPNLEAEGCTSADKVNAYDSSVLSYCNLKSGDKLNYSEFSALVRKTILDPHKREKICGNCEWTDLCR